MYRHNFSVILGAISISNKRCSPSRDYLLKYVVDLPEHLRASRVNLQDNVHEGELGSFPAWLSRLKSWYHMLALVVARVVQLLALSYLGDVSYGGLIKPRAKIAERRARVFERGLCNWASGFKGRSISVKILNANAPRLARFALRHVGVARAINPCAQHPRQVSPGRVVETIKSWAGQQISVARMCSVSGSYFIRGFAPARRGIKLVCSPGATSK